MTLTGVAGTDAPVVLLLGKTLGSVEFVPTIMSKDVPYPTTTEEFFHIANYYVEGNYVPYSSTMLQPYSLDKSNKVDFVYRLNPSDAYVEGAIYNFINRTVATTRAIGDASNLLNVVGEANVANGEVTMTATFNNTRSATSREDIAALRTQVGQNSIVTSDYVHVESTPIDAVIVNPKNNNAEYYARMLGGYLAGTNNENDAWVKTFVTLNSATNLYFKFDTSIDLNEYVNLYSITKRSALSALRFDGISYKFSLVNEFKGADNTTNMQEFVKLSDSGILSVVEKYNIAAVGRTPIVRVDAFVNDNYGTERLVASSYIKVEITDKDVVVGQDKEAVEIQMATKNFIYQQLENNNTLVNSISFQQINSDLYAHAGRTAENFWDVFGGANNEFNVKVTTTDKLGNTINVIDQTGRAGIASVSNEGITINVDLRNNSTSTSAVLIHVNNEVKTENTYMDKAGAEYVVTITIPADNKKLYSDYKFVQVMYVKEDCEKFNYNTLYHRTSYDNIAGDIILVKGQLNSSNNWEMSTYLGEHFEKIQGNDIFTYYNTHKNVTNIEFKSADNNIATINNNVISLNKELTGKYEVANVNYEVTLVNGEKCQFSYKVVFENPFVDGVNGRVKVSDLSGENFAYAAPLVAVKDLDNRGILKNAAGSDLNNFVLEETATNVYKVAMPTVTFAFDEEDANYTDFKSQLATGSIFDIDATTGKITWVNKGSKLTENKNFTVIATVTFEDLSVVECRIPVTIEIK